MSRESKEKRYDQDGIEMVIPEKEYYLDACGGIGINCIQQISGNITYFYTDKVGMASSLVGLVQSVAAIGDALSDIIMGRLVDKTNTPEGKCRPWIKRMIIPAFLSILFLLLIPRGVSANVQAIWAVVSNLFARAVVLTALMLPYTAMVNYMSQSLTERGKIGTIRQVASNTLGCIFNMLWIPITNLLGGTQRSWIIGGSVVAIIASLMLMISYNSSHERYTNAKTADSKDEDASISTLESLKILIHNKYWIYMMLAQFFLQVFYVLQGATQAYYCKWILGNDSFTFFINIVALGFMVLAFIVTPKIVERFPMRVVGLIGVAIGVGCTLIRMMFPTNIVVFVVGFGVVLFGVNLIGAVLNPMTINTTELNDLNYGHRVTGMASSAASFAAKMSQGAASMMIGFVLAATGYNAAATTQSASAIKGICALNIHFQGAALLIIAIFFFLYDFEKIYPEILAKNMERRAKADAGKNI